MQQTVMSTGYIKVGDEYINPHSITHISNNYKGGTDVCYYNLVSTYEKDESISESFYVDSDKFAKCAIKAMQTGEIVDIMA